MMHKVNSQMKAYSLDPSDPISIIGFLSTFLLACDTNSLHESAAMWILPFFVKNALATIVNSRMSAADSINLVVASVNSTEQLIQKNLLRSHSELVNCLLKKFSND